MSERPGRNDPCWCGSGKKYKKCHLAADRAQARSGARARAHRGSPPGATLAGRIAARGDARPWGERKILIKTPEEIEGIRRASQLAREVLDGVEEIVGEGVATAAIDRWVHDTITAAGAIPATLGYRGFPASSCISINEVICHGIPGERELRSGDIVNVDVTPILDGYYGDASRMYLVGEVSEEARRLVEVARECLDLGIAAVRPGHTVGDIGHAIQVHAEGLGYSVVREMTGHGVGIEFHEPPEVAHVGEPGKGPRLVPGMVFTIEPMINAGTWKLQILDDGWTAVTQDRSLSAQWEHTVAVTADGVDVLTA